MVIKMYLGKCVECFYPIDRDDIIDDQKNIDDDIMKCTCECLNCGFLQLVEDLVDVDGEMDEYNIDWFGDEDEDEFWDHEDIDD